MVYTFTGHEGAINSIAVSPDGKILASGGADSKIIVWNLSKKIFVEYAYYDEFQQEENASLLFKPRGKGEKKQEYEERTAKAKELEDQIVERYYQQYIHNLRELPFK